MSTVVICIAFMADVGILYQDVHQETEIYADLQISGMESLQNVFAIGW